MGEIELSGGEPHHVLDIKSLGKSGIESVIESIGRENSEINQKIALLFFENSTRTRLSFELAALNLGCRVLSPNLTTSSIQKGETALDTVTSIAAMGIDQMVIRSTENGFAERAAAAVGPNCRILNGGDGTHQHPTQALTDLYILNKHRKTDWTKLKVGIVGNISHSRVANSLIDGLSLMGVQSLNLIGPKAWMPKTVPDFANCFGELESGLADLDAIVMLRAQWERMPDLSKEQVKKLQENFRLTEKHLELMSKDAIVMHPGPVLRGEEASESLLEHPCVKINEQVAAGVLIREALLAQN